VIKITSKIHSHSLSLVHRFNHTTILFARLLGPCFKTGLFHISLTIPLALGLLVSDNLWTVCKSKQLNVYCFQIWWNRLLAYGFTHYSLSLQSSFQVSLTVLVFYRNHGLYLALWEIYPRLRYIISNIPTRLCVFTHPLALLVIRPLGLDLLSKILSLTSVRTFTYLKLGFTLCKGELFPFHSPLLEESLLFSFPPLINMLKLSGWLYINQTFLKHNLFPLQLQFSFDNKTELFDPRPDKYIISIKLEIAICIWDVDDHAICISHDFK